MEFMLTLIKRASWLPVFAGLALSQTACSLVPIEVTGDGKIQFEIDGTDNRYEEIVLFDPNDNEDYQRYKDQLDQGEIDSILLSVLRVYPTNRASWVSGQVDVRKHTEAGDSEWIEGVSAWGGLRLMGEPDTSGLQEPLLDEIFLNPATFDNYDEVNETVFKDGGPIDFKVHGIGDQGPIRFDLEVTVTFTVEN